VALYALLAAAMLSLAGCSLLPEEEQSLEPPLLKPVQENYELYEVKTGSITKSLTALATFSSSVSHQLYYKESGSRLLAIQVKRGDTVKKGDIVATLEKGDLESRIRLQQFNLEKAGIALLQVKPSGDSQTVRLREIDVEVAQFQLRLLQEQLDKTRLVADMDGIVTFLSDTQPGQQVAAYVPLVSLADPTQVQLVYDAQNSADLAGVRVGMVAEVKINSGMVKGKVTQTPSSAPLSDNKELSDLNSKRLVIGFDKDFQASIGESAYIEIVTEKKENVLVIPRGGLRSYLGRNYVQVLEGEARKEVDVEIGMNTATEIEIVKGLKEGQQIIMN
jgi:multidrug efflux pump subunit AcrA (membrane-fusion protein)